MKFRKMVIESPDGEIYNAAKVKWDGISKPIDGLGDFEELVCRIAAIQSDTHVRTEKKAVVVMCADNGVVAEGISQSESSVTLSVAKALGKGISTVCTLASKAGADVIPVDIGIDSDDDVPGIRHEKIARGTQDFLKEPAMSRETSLLALEKGVEIAEDLADKGYDLIATGEMGIGNTTTATALLCSLLGLDSDELTGRGAGLDDEKLVRKRQVIKEALSRYDFSECFNEKEAALEKLRTFGGLDIAALVGVYVGCAMRKKPVIIDGLISGVAAVVAGIVFPGTKDYMIASHCGREKGMELVLENLGLKPFINGNMALGEGTGAVMLFPLIDMAADFYNRAASFADYDLEQYKRYES